MLAEVENKKRWNTGTLTVNGKTFVLVPASQYRARIRRATTNDAPLPPKPKPQANGKGQCKNNFVFFGEKGV